MGAQAERLRDGLLPICGLADDLHAFLGVEDHAKAGPDERLVIDDEDTHDAAVRHGLARRGRCRVDQPVQADRALEVLEGLLAQVQQHERRTVVLLVVEQRARRLRHQDVATVAGGTDP